MLYKLPTKDNRKEKICHLSCALWAVSPTTTTLPKRELTDQLQLLPRSFFFSFFSPPASIRMDNLSDGFGLSNSTREEDMIRKRMISDLEVKRSLIRPKFIFEHGIAHHILRALVTIGLPRNNVAVNEY